MFAEEGNRHKFKFAYCCYSPVWDRGHGIEETEEWTMQVKFQYSCRYVCIFSVMTVLVRKMHAKACNQKNSGIGL